MKKTRLFLAACALMSTTASMAQADGDYYLYDAQNGLFLSRGANWGTEAAADKYGVPFTWNAEAGTIRFVDWSDTGLHLEDNGESIYTDNGSPTKWKFEETTDGYYLLTEGDAYVGHSSGGYGEYVHAGVSKSSATVWKLLTKAERDEIVNGYANKNIENVIAAAGLSTTVDAFADYMANNYAAKDMTTKVGTAKFTGSAGSWTWNGFNRTQGGQPAYGTDWCEIYQACGEFTQTIEGLTPGLYKMTVNAFERSKGWDDCNKLGEAGWEVVTAFFQANTEQVQLSSWYSGKEGSNNPDNTSQAAAAFNADKYKNEVYTYVGEDGKLDLKLAKHAFCWGSWVLFNNVTLTYFSDAVSDEDAAEIIAKADEYLAKAMHADYATAISEAKDAFEANKTIRNYNALKNALDNSENSIAGYATLKELLDKIAAELATTNFYTAEAYAQNYTDVLAKYEARSITNAEFTNYTFGSRLNGLMPAILLSTFAVEGGTPYINTWSTEHAADNEMKNPFFEYWVSDANVLGAKTISATLPGLEPNKFYDVTGTFRVRQSNDKEKIENGILLQVAGGEAVDVTTGDELGDTKRFQKSFTATGATDAQGNLKLTITVAEGSNISWLAFRDLTYSESTSVVAATTEDYAALNTAITEAEANPLGFLKDEYAPYNNVEALKALEAAKAIDPEGANLQAPVQAATEALTAATWKANTEEVNAVYNGDFALSENDGAMAGWQTDHNAGLGGQYHARAFVLTEGMNNFDKLAVFGQEGDIHSAAYFRFDGTNSSKTTVYTYGATAGYTMPLSDKTYTLKAELGGWGQSDKDVIVTIVDADGTELATQTVHTSQQRVSDDNGELSPVELSFTMTEAANVRILLKNGGDYDNAIVVSNIELMVDWQTTGIQTVETKSVKSEAIYNIAGQRVKNAQKGLYIVNGKKVMF